MNKIMNEAYHKEFDTLLGKVAAYYPDRFGEITGSWIVTGNCYNPMEGFMVIGRAPIGIINSQTAKWLPSEARSSKTRNKIQELICEKAEGRTVCPMSWVLQFGNDRSVCNTNKSAFWRVSKKLALMSDGANSSCWSSNLAWSNLYKIVSAEGGNPISSLKKIQFERCIKLLKIEVDLLNPRKVLVMTGESWYQPFIDGLGIQVIHSPMSFVEKIGQYKSQKWVFTQHPQSRRETYIESINEAFESFYKIYKVL